MNTASSPSRCYVAMCNRSNFDGHYFKRFTLPAADDPAVDGLHYQNDTQFAAWWFLNRIDAVACIDGCLTAEDYEDLRETCTQCQVVNNLHEAGCNERRSE